MAIKKCKECGKDVSTKAGACPHCGAQQPKQTSGCALLVLLFIGLPVLVAVVMSSLNRPASHRSAPASPAAHLTPEEREAALKRIEEESRGKQWNVIRGKSPKDDSPFVEIRTPAQNFARNVIGAQTVPQLSIRCQENKTDVIISIDGAYLDNDPLPVTIRLDSTEAQTETWNISTGHDAVFRRGAIPFARRLAASSKLWVRLTPYGKDPEQFTFATAGLEKHLPEVQRACGWK